MQGIQIVNGKLYALLQEEEWYSDGRGFGLYEFTMEGEQKENVSSSAIEWYLPGVDGVGDFFVDEEAGLFFTLVFYNNAMMTVDKKMIYKKDEIELFKENSIFIAEGREEIKKEFFFYIS